MGANRQHNEDDELEEVAGPRTTAAEEAIGISLLRQASKRREASSLDLHLDVPSWGGDLQAAYRVVDRARLEALIRKSMQAATNASARTRADIDVILEANVGLYVYDPSVEGDDEDERRIPVEDDVGIVTWDRFGEVLRRIRPGTPELNSSWQTVMEAFKHPKDDRSNAVAISAHALTIARWMRDPSKDPTEEAI